MKVLMFSMERGLVGEKIIGDAVERHRKYAEVKVSDDKAIEELNIVVFAKRGYQKEQLSDKVFAYPTDSKKRCAFFWDAYKIGRQLYADRPYDLVIGDFFTGLSAWLLKRKFKIKFLLHLHGDFWGNTRALEGKWHNWPLLAVNKFLAYQADGIRVVSSGIQRRLTRWGVRRKKIEVINTPTSIYLLDQPDESAVGKIRDKYKNKKMVLFIGRLEKVKNLDWLIRVFKQVKDEWPSESSNEISGRGGEADSGEKGCVLVIIGDGRERTNLEKIVDELGLQGDVLFEGKVSVTEWKNYFQVARMLVLPSLAESFGNVLALAGAAGLPVVASQTAGAQDIVQDQKTGFLLPVNNQKRWKEAIGELLKNEDKARKMGEAARVYCRDKFDPDKTTRRIVEFWWRIVEGK